MAVRASGVWGWMFFDWASQLLFHVDADLHLRSLLRPCGDGGSGPSARNTGDGCWPRRALSSPSWHLSWDRSPTGRVSRLRWIGLFSVLYVCAAASLWWALPGSGHWLLILVAFGLGMVAVEFATIFTNAMLPGLGPKSEVGLISGSGWAFGYAGGILSLLIALLLLAENEAGVTLLGNPPAFGLDAEAREGTRATGVLTALWYAVFMVPFFLWVREKPGLSDDSRTMSGLIDTIRNLPGNRSLLAYLGSSMLYRDALNGLFAFGGIYATGVLGWSLIEIGVFGIASLVSGCIFAWLGGFADRRFGPKRVIVFCISLLSLVCAVIITTSDEMILLMPVGSGSPIPDITFMLCGCLIGAGGGVLQAVSRTMMVVQANPDRMTEAFGLYAFAGRATAFLAPAMVAATTSFTGSQRFGVIPLILLFLAGLALMRWVNSEGYGNEAA